MGERRAWREEEEGTMKKASGRRNVKRRREPRDATEERKRASDGDPAPFTERSPLFRPPALPLGTASGPF
jgi:hypothetical protein